jgi:hypothetical protein
MRVHLHAKFVIRQVIAFTPHDAQERNHRSLMFNKENAMRKVALALAATAILGMAAPGFAMESQAAAQTRNPVAQTNVNTAVKAKNVAKVVHHRHGVNKLVHHNRGHYRIHAHYYGNANKTHS